MKEQLDAIRTAAHAALENVRSKQELEELRVRFLGKKGELTGVLKQMGKLSAEERPVIGQLANEVRAELEAHFAECMNKMEEAALEARLQAETLDVTMPGTPRPLGHRTRWRSSPMKFVTFSSVWDFPSRAGRRLNMITIISKRSTCRKTTLRAIRRIRFILTIMCCCARRPHRFRCA